MRFGTSSITVIPRPRIERERDGGGWFVLLPNGQGWLHSDRRAALDEFNTLIRIKRFGR
jgi:hypothetical protein